MKKVIALIVVLGISTMASGGLPAPMIMPKAFGGDAVTVNGDLSDWASAAWVPLNFVLCGLGTDVSDAQYAARWDDNGIYMAVTLTDTVPVYESNPAANWNTDDHLEVYVDSANTNYVGYAYSPSGLPYGDAQQYVVRPDPLALPGTWQVLGWPGIAPPLPATVALQITGSLMEYEMYIPAQYQQAPIGLTFGSTVGLDLAYLSNSITTYVMLQNNDVGGKFNDASAMQDWILIPEPITMVLLGLGGVALIRRKK